MDADRPWYRFYEPSVPHGIDLFAAAECSFQVRQRLI